MEKKKAITAPELARMKARSERVVMVTAYDYPSALLADAAGVDVILVGDSLGMVVLGHQTTIPVTLEDVLHHTRAVCRANPQALVVADLPFLSYRLTPEEALRNAGRLIQEGGAGAVKLEGGRHVAPTVERMVQAGIPVVGHLGLTPQSVRALGGFRVQARKPDSARRLLDDARLLEEAGACGIVLELIPTEVAREVSRALSIPTIGIGAGPDCDGEVQVLHDVLGIFDGYTPKHAKRYAELGEAMRAALRSYVDEVRAGTFPTEAQTTHARDLEDADSWTL